VLAWNKQVILFAVIQQHIVYIEHIMMIIKEFCAMSRKLDETEFGLLNFSYAFLGSFLASFILFLQHRKETKKPVSWGDSSQESV